MPRRTSIVVDDALLEEAQQALGTRGLKETVYAALHEAIVAALSGFEREPLLASLEKAGVPASPINTIGEMFADPQVSARGLRMELEDGGGNALPSVRSPIVLSQTPLAYSRPSPRLGEHTDEILAELDAKS